MKTFIRNLKFVLLVVASSMALLTGSPKAEISGLETYPLVCQKGLVALDHDIDSFNRLFGSPISKKSYKLVDPDFDGDIMTELAYLNAVTLTYQTGREGKNMIYELTLGSAKAQKIAGFDVQTKRGIRKLYGTPYKETLSSLIYQCEGQVLTFTTKNGQITTVKIQTESSAI
jgi:hypothetical protein